MGTSDSDLLDRTYPGRRAELKRAILRETLASVNAHGVEATTIDMVRTAVDTSVGAIYHHFGNKEGLIAALFLAALDDMANLREQYLASAKTADEGVRALVYSYVDWVIAQPEWARFQYQARDAVSKGPHAAVLSARNRERNLKLATWFADAERPSALLPLAPELLPSLVVGPSDSYCRAWLSGRVNTSPQTHREALADAAWRCVGKTLPTENPAQK